MLFYNYLAAVEVQPQSVTHKFTRARYSALIGAAPLPGQRIDCPGQILQIRDCPGDSGTVGAYVPRTCQRPGHPHSQLFPHPANQHQSHRSWLTTTARQTAHRPKKYLKKQRHHRNFPTLLPCAFEGLSELGNRPCGSLNMSPPDWFMYVANAF